jgi:hypothetical protein
MGSGGLVRTPPPVSPTDLPIAVAAAATSVRRSAFCKARYVALVPIPPTAAISALVASCQTLSLSTAAPSPSRHIHTCAATQLLPASAAAAQLTSPPLPVSPPPPLPPPPPGLSDPGPCDSPGVPPASPPRAVRSVHGGKTSDGNAWKAECANVRHGGAWGRWQR